jgi:hypothetical protein
MRIKTLLIAAAALAVGVISSEAQVYSQNIVGYANISGTDPSAFYMLECPFNVGASNGANEIFGTNLPAESQILTWDPNASAFATAIFDNTYGPGTPLWYQADDYTPTNPPILLPGVGFYLFSFGAGFTNTFAGAVAVSSGGTNVAGPYTGSTFNLVGSVIPYTGYVTNAAPGTSQGVNLVSLPDESQVMLWNEQAGGFQIYVYDTSYGNGTNWYQADDYTPGPCPSVSVGQGFFVYPFGANYSWTQSLP